MTVSSKKVNGLNLLIGLTIVFVVLLIAVFVTVCGHQLYKQGWLNDNKLVAHEKDVVEDGSSYAENGNQPSEDEIPRGGCVDSEAVQNCESLVQEQHNYLSFT